MEEDAQIQTVNYEGGSLSMVRGALRIIFGANLGALNGDVEAVNSDVVGHPRVRVIGEPASQVRAHNRTYNQYPTSNANGAAAGKKCIFTFAGSDGAWVGRVSGPMAALADYLTDNAVVRTEFRTARGTKYGPFLTITA